MRAQLGPRPGARVRVTVLVARSSFAGQDACGLSRGVLKNSDVLRLTARAPGAFGGVPGYAHDGR